MESLEGLSAPGNESDLVAAARTGDRAAFSLLVARYRNLVYGYAYARLGVREEAEDIAQEAFVRAYLALGQLRGPRAWRAWLMRIVRNLCTDAARRSGRRQTEPLDPSWPDDGQSPEVRLLAAERDREVRQAVMALPDKYRIPVLMRFGSGCTRKEIAVALGLPESTIMGRIARGLRVLRREIGEESER